MKRMIFVLFCLGCIFFAKDLFAVDGVTDTEVKLGMVNAQTGPAAGLGKGMRTGAEAVIKEINNKGGINGRKINLLVADDGYEPDKAIDETVKMIEENKVFALFGYVGTPTANAVIPIVKENKTPLVGLFTGAMTLRKPVIHEIINIRASYDDEPEMLVERFIKDTGAKKFAVFYQDDGFGMAVLSGTEKALKKRGLEVAAKGTFQRNTTAVKAGLVAVMEANPDVVIMVGPYTPLSVFIKEAKAAGLKSQLATVSFVGTDSLVKLTGNEGDGVVISQVVPFPEDLSLPVTKECSTLIAKHAPDEKLGFVNFEGCITAKAMVLALEKVGKDLTRENLIKAFEDMKNADIGGVSFTMGPDDHQALDHVFLTQIKGGKITQISTIGK